MNRFKWLFVGLLIIILQIGGLIFFRSLPMTSSGSQKSQLQVEYEKVIDSYSKLLVYNSRLEEELNELKTAYDLLEEEKESLEGDYNNLKKDYPDLVTMSHEDHYKLVMSRFSAMIRLDHYEDFNTREKTYTIHTDHTLEDGWYRINGPTFKLELHGYEDAKSVEFYYTKQETDMGYLSLYKDTDSSDGWIYSNEDIGEFFEVSELDYSRWPASYSMTAEVTLSNGDIIRTPLILIYHVNAD